MIQRSWGIAIDDITVWLLLLDMPLLLLGPLEELPPRLLEPVLLRELRLELHCRTCCDRWPISIQCFRYYFY